MTPIAELLIRMGVDDKEVDAVLEKTSGKFDKLGQKLGDTGKKMTLGVTLPILGAGVAAFKMASDANEAISQVGQVFGSEADEIIKSSKNMADAFSQDEFLSFAGNIGDIVQGMGIAKDESDDWATSILSLGQDLASFKNEDPTRVIQAITSALTGERESLKGLGIVINDAMVKTKAFEMGLWDGKGALDQTAQAQATMALITEKSANAIGDFDRTAEDAANKTRTLTKNFKDTAASLGSHLLPMGTKLLGWVNGLVTGFSNLSPGAQKAILLFGGIVAAVGPLLLIIGKFATTYAALAPLLAPHSAAIMAAMPWLAIGVALVALVILIVANWDKIVAFLKRTWDWIQGAASAVGEWVSNAFKKALEFVKNLFLNWTGPGLIIKHWDTIKAAALAVKDWIVDKFNAVVSFFAGLPGRIGAAVSGMWDGIKNGFRSAVNWVIDKWNGIRFTIPSIDTPFGKLGGGSIGTPNIPRLHGGGVFRAPSGQREGLALLEDGERVTPDGMGSGGTTYIIKGDVYGWDDFVRKVRDAQLGADRRGWAV